MKNDSINYKFAFVAIIIAYIVAQVFVIYFKPDAERYIPLLQFLFFLIPVILLNDNNFKTQYKINLRFSFSTIPVILWILVGISLIEIGSDIIIRTMLPTYIVSIYDTTLQSYSNTINIMLLNNSNSVLEFAIISFCFAITPAVCEEVFFRGYLMQNIEQKNSIRKAIIFSALIFALIHFNIIGIIPIFIIGLCLGYLFYRTGSIIPPMILHFINNFLVILSVNYYYGDEITITNIRFGIISLIIGVLIVFISFKRLKIKKQYSIMKNEK